MRHIIIVAMISALPLIAAESDENVTPAQRVQTVTTPIGLPPPLGQNTAVSDPRIFWTSVARGGTTLVIFTAKWCGTCQQQKPFIDAYAKFHPDVQVMSVDIDESPDIAWRFGIANVPTLALHSQGRLVAISTGGRTDAGIAQWVSEGLQSTSPIGKSSAVQERSSP